VGGGCVLVEVDATVGELAEGSLLLDLGSLNGSLLQRERSQLVMSNSGPTRMRRPRGTAREIGAGRGDPERRTYSSAMIAVD
jgi:hypothetical protein